MIIVNTGDGKGKTTASMGQVLRVLGHGKKACIVQLFKGEKFYGEQNILLKLENLDFFSFCKEHPFLNKNVSIETARRECGEAVLKLKSLASQIGALPQELCEKYDLIVLEEFNAALRGGLIDKEEFFGVLKKLSEKSDIIVTGRGAPPELIELADLVTEMKEIKHPFNKGVKAREGIEF